MIRARQRSSSVGAPQHDDELAKIAGWHRFDVFTENLRRLGQSGLGEVKAELHLLPENTHS